MSAHCKVCGQEIYGDVEKHEHIRMGGSSLAAPAGSATVRYLMQGHRKQQPGRWETIGDWPTEQDARSDEADYREWQSKYAGVRWLDFRLVRETTTREVLPNHTISDSDSTGPSH